MAKYSVLSSRRRAVEARIVRSTPSDWVLRPCSGTARDRTSVYVMATHKEYVIQVFADHYSIGSVSYACLGALIAGLRALGAQDKAYHAENHGKISLSAAIIAAMPLRPTLERFAEGVTFLTYGKCACEVECGPSDWRVRLLLQSRARNLEGVYVDTYTFVHGESLEGRSAAAIEEFAAKHACMMMARLGSTTLDDSEAVT